jgi:hypothetical protein
MSIVLAVVSHPAFLATVPFVVPLLLFGVLFQPPGLPARGRPHPTPARSVLARLEAERKRSRRPTGWQSPAWTVQREAVR